MSGFSRTCREVLAPFRDTSNYALTVLWSATSTNAKSLVGHGAAFRSGLIGIPAPALPTLFSGWNVGFAWPSSRYLVDPMLALGSETALVQIVLISDKNSQITSILNDIKQSAVKYSFACLSKRGELIFNFSPIFNNLKHDIPTIFILDYRFSLLFIKPMIEIINSNRDGASVEFVILDPPHDNETRDRLRALGTTLHDSAPLPEYVDLTVH